jgi:hypothetical protein
LIQIYLAGAKNSFIATPTEYKLSLSLPAVAAFPNVSQTPLTSVLQTPIPVPLDATSMAVELVIESSLLSITYTKSFVPFPLAVA